MHDVSLNEAKSPSKNFILKLDQSTKYHGFSDALGIIYIFDGEMRRPVTQYHKAFGHRGYKNFRYDYYNPGDEIFWILYFRGSMQTKVFKKSIFANQNFWMFYKTELLPNFNAVNIPNNVNPGGWNNGLNNLDNSRPITYHQWKRLSVLWSTKKERFYSGPLLPSLSYSYQDNFCTANFNRSHVILVAFGVIKTLLFDTMQEKVTTLPDISHQGA